MEVSLLLEWLFKAFGWFASKLQEEELPRIMILVVVFLTVIGVLVGVGILPIPRTPEYEANPNVHPATDRSLAPIGAILGALVCGYLGALLGILIAYLYHMIRYG